MKPFSDQLAAIQGPIERHLAALLSREAERGAPKLLVEAMQHAVLGGGKRFRPFLALESAALFGVAPEHAAPAACAVELIHCYSLVHDDLPSMDNDELRRGQPTVWKKYGEWTAVLTGDALQGLAFEAVSTAEAHPDPLVRAELCCALAVASGASGMVGGQALDLEAENNNAPPAVAHIQRLQDMKTGKLIAVACEMGAILGRAKPDDRARLKTYGDRLGFAFQISDDLLDAEGSAASTGKATGKDAAAGKATLVSLNGIKHARYSLDEAVQTAIDYLRPFGARAAPLIDAAQFMKRRES